MASRTRRRPTGSGGRSAGAPSAAGASRHSGSSRTGPAADQAERVEVGRRPRSQPQCRQARGKQCEPGELRGAPIRSPAATASPTAHRGGDRLVGGAGRRRGRPPPRRGRRAARRSDPCRPAPARTGWPGARRAGRRRGGRRPRATSGGSNPRDDLGRGLQRPHADRVRVPGAPARRPAARGARRERRRRAGRARQDRAGGTVGRHAWQPARGAAGRAAYRAGCGRTADRRRLWTAGGRRGRAIRRRARAVDYSGRSNPCRD